jgi:hypothetical protein
MAKKKPKERKLKLVSCAVRAGRAQAEHSRDPGRRHLEKEWVLPNVVKQR